MNQCLITTVSMTLAMRVKSTLTANGIHAAITRLPPAYTTEGCAYGVEIAAAAADRAYHVLQISDVPFGKIVCPDGRPVRRGPGRGINQ